MLNDSGEYDQIAENIYAPIYPVIAEMILRRTGVNQGSLLDIGCGGGHLAFALLAKGDFQAVLADIREDALRIAIDRGQRAGWAEKFSVSCQDVQNMDFADNHFDLIVSRGSMPFWTDQPRAFREIYRVLAPGGQAYIGGGMGSKQLRAQILDKMDTDSKSCFEHIKKISLSLTNQQYYDLFAQLTPRFEIIENDGEGRWLHFGKEANDD
ncbi:MAG: class I SAM-dependent methyltransferase [Clostridiales bacterium]